VSQQALDAGTEEVVLFTDLANPVSNSIYQRLGYRPVEDRVVLALPPDLARPSLTPLRSPVLGAYWRALCYLQGNFSVKFQCVPF
jgi:hypothetical protein